MNWIYQIIKALLDWLRETPPPTIRLGEAPPDLKKELDAYIDATRAGRVRDGKGDPRP